MDKKKLINSLIVNLQKCDEGLRLLCIFGGFNSECDGCRYKLSVTGGSGCPRKDIQELIGKYMKAREEDGV